MQDMYLIVGLGNPGRKYDKTRHNTGFRVIDALSEKMNIPVKKKGQRALFGIGKHEGLTFMLAKPQTYMNLSGEAVRGLMEYYHIPVENLLVISDDVYLDPGVIRIRENGSAGGHNGLKNIILQLAGDSFKRLRLGVGKKPEERDLIEFVMESFSKEDAAVMKRAYPTAADAAIAIFTEGLAAAMNRYNGKKV
jgi:PTH1 family peptidyl-tRNA hydrolase